MSTLGKAQTIIVGAIDKSEDRFRNEQLLSKTDSLVSFCIRPLSYASLHHEEKEHTDKMKRVSFDWLPLRTVQQYNTFAPLGWNDGSMIPARGYQTLLSAGFRTEYGALTVQLNPEYVFADNPSFETFPLTAKDLEIQNHIYYLNTMDTPERFGTSNYSKLFWGQSSIRLNSKSFSMGLSTENLWWGPGQRNSLIMSNNAPGFPHFTINTRKPIKTILGSIEGQLLFGRLDASGYDSPEAAYMLNGANLKIPKRNDWRYFNGFSLSYHPKWVPGLFLGMNRVFQVYSKDLGHGFTDYLPVVIPFQKKNLSAEDAKSRDQYASLFFRWVLKESKAELYFESGWNDNSQDLWDFVGSPSHSRAYQFGFTKLFPFSSDKNKYFRLNIENTQMEQTADQIVRDAHSWYQHGIIWHGYTHESQILGAGIGPGANLQTLDCSIWNRDNVVGIQLERYMHNLDYYYNSHQFDKVYNHKWVDLNFNTYMYRSFGKLGVQLQLNTAYMHSYEWVYGNNRINFQTKVSLLYHF